MALAIIYFAVFLAVFAIFGLIPIVGTVGLQIQQAAFADCARSPQQRLLTSPKLAALSLVLGIGFILGCLLTPFTYALSMRTTEGAISWSVILGLAIGWAGIFFLWARSIARLAKNLYLKHLESNTPHQKRRWLTKLSAVLLFPLFCWMCLVQILFGAQTVDPTLLSISTLIARCAIAGVFAFSVYGIILVIGWRLGTAKGWFGEQKCPYCNSIINNQKTLLQTCPECHHPIASWTRLPPPVSFPIPPSPTSSFFNPMDAPPPV